MVSFEDERPTPKESSELVPPPRRPPTAVGAGTPPPPERPVYRRPISRGRRSSWSSELFRVAVGLVVGVVGIAVGLVAKGLSEVTRPTRERR